VDDILDYEAGETTLGKPGGADLRLGLATGPALYAWEEHPQLGPLIQRKFDQEGDVELVSVLSRIACCSEGIIFRLEIWSADRQVSNALEILHEYMQTRPQRCWEYYRTATRRLPWKC
jgi:geranylgeranyl pyrophosphate synthase